MNSLQLTNDPKKLDAIVDLFSELINGRYAPVRHIDKGGMGFVFEAHDELLNRAVALKIYIGDFDTQDDRQFVYDLYHKESQVAASLNHPNIVSIYEVGQFERSPDKNPFIVMEYIDGLPLATIIKNTQLTLQQTVIVFKQIAQALNYAHTREVPVLHRDINPKNILVGYDNHAVLIDFGLSRFLDGSGTQMGVFKGTSGFMAPEVLDAFFRQDEEFTKKATAPTADLYALGACLYRCLTGKNPVPGTVASQVMQQINTHQIETPSSLNSEITNETDELVMSLLEKDPSRRLNSARELFQRLESIEAACQEQCPTMITAGMGVQTSKRSKPLSRLWSVFAMLSIVGAGIFGWSHREQSATSDMVQGSIQPKKMGDDIVVWKATAKLPTQKSKSLKLAAGSKIKDVYLQLSIDSNSRKVEARLRLDYINQKTGTMFFPRGTRFIGQPTRKQSRYHIQFSQAIHPSGKIQTLQAHAQMEDGSDGLVGKPINNQLTVNKYMPLQLVID